MAKITEEVVVSISVTITYEKKKGAREHALSQIKLGCNVFGFDGRFGGYEIKSKAEQLAVT